MADENQVNLGSDPSLLLVDDDDIFVNRLARAMERRGFVPTVALSVADALTAVKAAPAAYAVVDLRLEDGSGLDVVEALRDARADARIIVLTGTAPSQPPSRRSRWAPPIICPSPPMRTTLFRRFCRPVKRCRRRRKIRCRLIG